MANSVLFGAVSLHSKSRGKVVFPISCADFGCSGSAPEHVVTYLETHLEELVQWAEANDASEIKLEFLCWTDACEHEGLPLLEGFEERCHEFVEFMRRNGRGVVLNEPRHGSHCLSSRLEHATAVRPYVEHVIRVVRDADV